MISAYQYRGHTHLRVSDNASLEEDQIRVLLHPSQAQLVDQYVRGKRRLQGCSMNVVEEKNLSRPAVLLQELSAVSDDLTGGGPRELRQPELAALLLSSLPAHDLFGPGGKLCGYLQQHPAVKAGLGFAYADAEIPAYPLILLLKEIYDIRRLSDTEAPAKSSRLRNYFRLADTRAMFRLCAQAPLVTPAQVRTQLAVHGWRSQSFQYLSREQVEAEPRAFLFRAFVDYADHYQKQANAYDSYVFATWRTTNRFLVFLQRLWQSGVAGLSFDPARFFRRQDEVESFHQFIEPLDKGLDNPGMPEDNGLLEDL